MWNFKGTLWNSTQNIFPIHWKMRLSYNIEISRAFIFKNSKVFLNCPPDGPMVSNVDGWIDGLMDNTSPSAPTILMRYLIHNSFLMHWDQDKMADIFQTFSNAFSWMKIFQLWLKFHWSLFLSKCPINNIPALVQIMAWCRPGNKPLSEPMMASLLMHICITRPQWVNKNGCFQVKHTWAG